MKGKPTKAKRPVRAIPLPEAIDGKRWDIQQSRQPRTAGISLSGDKMVVPMGDNELERLIRLHEMTHISITPRDEVAETLATREVSETVLNMCEDARVHSQMYRMGFNPKGIKNIVSDAELEELAVKEHPATLAASAAAMYRTGESERLWEYVADTGDEDRLQIVEYGRSLSHRWMHEMPELPEFERTVEMAKEIQEMLGNPDDPEPPPPPQVPPNMLTRVTAPPEQRPLPPPANTPQLKPPPGKPVQNPGKGPWCAVIFEEPPRPLKFPAKMRGRPKKRIPAPRGRRFHRVGRLYVDGYVFADRPKKKGGGAILIDTSGSMSLTVEDVLMLCKEYPGGIIAAYSCGGRPETDALGNVVGTLRVIAKNGKRVYDDQLSTPGGGNGIDGPALDWLARQPGPRYWISDAGVEGGETGLHYCLSVCRKHNITRVDNAWEIVGKTFD